MPDADSSSRARVCEVEERGELCVPSVPMAGAASKLGQMKGSSQMHVVTAGL